MNRLILWTQPGRLPPKPNKLSEMALDTHELALRIRLDALRMVNRAKTSHIGSIFSMADIVAVLYGRIMAKRPHEPQWPERDRFVLSKGHAGAAVYAALAATGYFDSLRLEEYCCGGSVFCGHISHEVPGVEISTGSLGHGLPIAAGMAYAARQDGKPHRVFTVLSDGECDEGSNWEAILFAAHHRLGNLVAVVDYNKIQSLAPVAETLALEPFADKWRAFGWKVIEVDGHDHETLAAALDVAPQSSEKPTCVLAHTIKGKGVSFMEHSVLWHYRTPQGEEFEAALAELEGRIHA